MKQITEKQVVDILKEIIDPEIGVDIYTLELIRDIKIKKENIIITMTFTSPMCPYAPILMKNIEENLKIKLKIKSVDVNITFNPPWKPSEDLREMLGI